MNKNQVKLRNNFQNSLTQLTKNSFFVSSLYRHSINKTFLANSTLFFIKQKAKAFIQLSGFSFSLQTKIKVFHSKRWNIFPNLREKKAKKSSFPSSFHYQIKNSAESSAGRKISLSLPLIPPSLSRSSLLIFLILFSNSSSFSQCNRKLFSLSFVDFPL